MRSKVESLSPTAEFPSENSSGLILSRIYFEFLARISQNEKMLKNFCLFGVFGVFLALGACVPKTQYEDQQEQLQTTKAQLEEIKQAQTDCDPEAFIRLKEQAQSLDVLQQELLDRNTELSNEVARLRVLEGQSKLGSQECEGRLAEQRAAFEAQLDRVKVTYEDTINELRNQIRERDAQIASLKAAKSTPPAAASQKAAPKNPKKQSQKSSTQSAPAKKQ